MSSEMRECPFCGGEAERIDFGPGSGDNEGGSCVACTRCQSSGPVEFGYKENFVSNWNRRNGEQCRAASVGGDVCATRQGHGMIGWTTGQTPEQFDQHEAPCPDCSDNASQVAPAEIESVIERLAAEAAACITVLGRAPEASDVRVMLDAAKLLRALSRGVPEGMVLVPVEPTAEMQRAFESMTTPYSFLRTGVVLGDFTERWKAAIAAQQEEGG